MKSSLLHVSIFFTAVFLLGCATQKTMVPTGGSRSDGTVKLSYQFGMFEKPQVDSIQALSSAKQRCNAWGYSGAEAFGGATRSCINSSGGGCNTWQVTVEYQCTGTPTASK